MSILQHIQGHAFFAFRKSLAELIAGTVLLTVVYYLVISIYNLYFNPLAKFPGPKLASISQIPYIKATLKGKHYVWIQKLHEQYDSDIIRVSPNELSIIGPSAWTDICGGRPGRHAFEQDPKIHGKSGSMIAAPWDSHLRQRRAIGQAFSTKATLEQHPVVESYIGKLMTRLHEQTHNSSQGKVDLVNWFNWTSFDIIGDFALGECFGCLSDQAYHPWVASVFASLKNSTLISIARRVGISESLLLRLYPKRLQEHVKTFNKFLHEKFDRRLVSGSTRPDFLTPLLESNKKEEKGLGLTEAEIRANMSLLIIAGSETVVTVACGAVWHLLKYPETLRPLLDEIQGTFHSAGEITAQSVKNLPYLNAVISETMRLYPSAMNFPAVRVPPEGDTVCGQWIPGNTGISIPQYTTFRSPRNFTSPTSFLPTRWLNPTDSRFAEDRPGVFHPFGVGPRSCVGKALGETEARLILANLFWGFEVELVEETERDWLEQEVYLTWMKTPLEVRLRERVHLSGLAGEREG